MMATAYDDAVTLEAIPGAWQLVNKNANPKIFTYSSKANDSDCLEQTFWVLVLKFWDYDPYGNAGLDYVINVEFSEMANVDFCFAWWNLTMS
ncbi:hypothetical protein L596_026403 [Steinernema carpocapsae]|uniref:Uncharacterized protein n=1 Tax=Steinernema carpocapsae TaxID=34508 RepID=A0A4V5ZY58_STECR|nr:hypothetical protein L596_026403 [Steinernema carpocapsae]